MQPAKSWEDRNSIQKLIDNAAMHDRDSAGKTVIWKDRSGRGASAALLKGVLNALLTFFPNMHPSELLLASRCGRGIRSVQRAIEVLRDREILLVEESEQGRRGGRFNRYRIDYTKLKLLAPQQGSLWNQKTRATTRHQDSDHAPPGRDHAPPGPQPRATGGALTQVLRTKKDQTEEYGEKVSLDREEIIRLAYRVTGITGKPTSDQADEIIAVCEKVYRGEFPENLFEVALESTKKARPRNPFAYWMKCIRNQVFPISP